MFEIQQIDPSEQKESICRAIVDALPDWFGIEAYIKKFIEESKSIPFFAVFNDNKPIGFVSIKIHNSYTAEIYVLGILTEYHRQGIGKKLIEHCESFCRKRKIEYLTVKTSDESGKNRHYEKTRHFYFAVGFRPLEVFPLFWDKDNPCLFMVKYLN